MNFIDLEQKFRRNMSPPSSGSDSYILLAGFLLGLKFKPEDGGGMPVRNVS
jgi:hypothetical protein